MSTETALQLLASESPARQCRWYAMTKCTRLALYCCLIIDPLVSGMGREWVGNGRGGGRGREEVGVGGGEGVKVGAGRRPESRGGNAN